MKPFYDRVFWIEVFLVTTLLLGTEWVILRIPSNFFNSDSFIIIPRIKSLSSKVVRA